MMPFSLVCQLPTPIYDAVIVDGRIAVALGSSVALLERGAVIRSFPCAAQHLVVAADAQSLLCVSPVLNQPEYYPMRQLDPPEETRRTRQVWRLAAPWERLEALGVAEVDNFSPIYDGNLWPVYEGDDIRLLACVDDRLVVVAEHRSFWPTAIEWTPKCVWLETSSLGMSHFETLALPTLALLESGDLSICDLEFPPEQFNALHSPALARPIFTVNAAAVPETLDDERRIVRHPIRGIHRVATLERVVTPLPTHAAGLVGAEDRALCWISDGVATQVLTIDLVSAQVIARATFAREAQIGARLCGRTGLLWSQAVPPGRPHRLLLGRL